jgi:hypothetical protein
MVELIGTRLHWLEHECRHAAVRVGSANGGKLGVVPLTGWMREHSNDGQQFSHQQHYEGNNRTT